MNLEFDANLISDQNRKNILGAFGEQDNMEKALSKDQFNEKYGEGFDVFTPESLEKFEAEAKKDGITEDIEKGIKEEFATLKRVFVKGVDTKTGLGIVFVRESKKEDAASEESIEGQEK